MKKKSLLETGHKKYKDNIISINEYIKCMTYYTFH